MATARKFKLSDPLPIPPRCVIAFTREQLEIVRDALNDLLGHKMPNAEYHVACREIRDEVQRHLNEAPQTPPWISGTATAFQRER